MNSQSPIANSQGTDGTGGNGFRSASEFAFEAGKEAGLRQRFECNPYCLGLQPDLFREWNEGWEVGVALRMGGANR